MTSHNKLIERIGAIPADRLIVIERTRDILECGDSSPLCQKASFARHMASKTADSHQRPLDAGLAVGKWNGRAQ